MRLFDFGGISYSTAGNYRYKVTEVQGSHGGVTYDTHTADITVTVTDADGQLTASATVENGTFTNIYDASAEYNAAGAEAGAAASVQANPFDAVTFDESDDGLTYTYTIR